MSDQSTSIKFTLSGAPKAWNEEAGELLGEWADGIEAVFINSTESGEDFVTVDEIAWGGNEYSTRYRVDGGWYEEDVEYARVVVGFPSVFDGRWKEDARAALKNWSPDAYEAFFKEEIPEGQSYIKDGRLFKERNRDRFLARATWGDWYEQTPKGFVLVYAEKESTGEKGHFLVPTEEYRGGRPKVGSFIVDEARHERVPDPGLPTTKNIQEVRA